MRVVLLLLASYVAGSVPTSYLMGKARGVDLRSVGSGNLGATNVFRALGAKVAVPVALVDMTKGFLPVWFFPLWDGDGRAGLALAYGLCAIAGHVWSVFLRFRGGKGVATAAGVMLALAPLAALTGVLVWVGLVLITRVASLASLVAATVVPMVAYMSDTVPGVTAFCVVVAGLVWWTHRGNIDRLWHGEEPRIRRKEAQPDGASTQGHREVDS